MDAERTDDLHRQVWELIPWYVNATLSPAEARRVDDHVVACPRCRREVEAQRELAAELRRAGEEELPPLPHRGAERLLARLDGADEDGGITAGPDAVGEAVGDARGETDVAASGTAGPGGNAPPWWLPAAGLAAALLAALGLALWSPAPAPPAFRTLTDAPAAASSPGIGETSGQRVRLVFAPTASERELRRLLLAENGSLVAGPSPYGVYTARFPRPDDARLDRLRASPLVVFAEPVEGGPAAVSGGEAGETR
jgi:hypothetical protein